MQLMFPTGHGSYNQHGPTTEAAEMGRHVERWRFRDVQAGNPRLYVHADDEVFGLDVGKGAINGSTDS